MLPLVVSLGSCAALPTPETPPPERQSEAASTHIAVIAVAPWQDYVDDIQPKFDLSAEEAFKLAVPTTASFQSKLAQAFAVRLALGLPTASTSDVQKTVQNADGTTSKTRESTKTTKSGESQKIQDRQLEAPEAAAAKAIDDVLADDPILKYNSASDLYQEVKILNRNLKDAIIRQNYSPFFLRMKVAVIPYRRDLQYDAYSDISFFLPENYLPQTSNFLQGSSDLLPVVVPILVTDNLESAKDSASDQAVVELGLALSGTVGGAGVGSQIDASSDRIRSAVTNDRNALQTVVRLGENAIRVRLGAVLQSGTEAQPVYELIPRTYTVSLLILVPNQAVRPGTSTPLSLVSRTTLKDTKLGRQLQVGRAEVFNNWIGFIIDNLNLDKRFNPPPQNCSLDLSQTAEEWVKNVRTRYVLYGQYDAYRHEADCVFSGGKIANSYVATSTYQWPSPAARSAEFAAVQQDAQDLWASLTSFNADYGIQAQVIDLPPTEPYKETTGRF